MDIPNNLLNGPFRLDVKAAELTELNISNNNFTSVRSNFRKYAPYLKRIDLNGNYLDCDGLTSLLLFMYFDSIQPIFPGEEAAESENTVRGIQCYRPKKDVRANSYETAKEQLKKTIDERYAQSETRLIELFKNMTASKR